MRLFIVFMVALCIHGCGDSNDPAKPESRAAKAPLKTESGVNNQGPDLEALLQEANEMFERKEYLQIVEEFFRYRNAGNEELSTLVATAAKEAERATYPEQEAKLLAELKTIPASNTQANLKRYIRLAEIDPSNESYAEKYVFYKAQETKERATARESVQKMHVKQQQIESQFSGWDGSHRGLTNLVKQGLREPKSFEHIETRYSDRGDVLRVRMKYRARNGFGGMSLGSVLAEVPVSGDGPIRIIESTN